MRDIGLQNIDHDNVEWLWLHPARASAD